MQESIDTVNFNQHVMNNQSELKVQAEKDLAELVKADFKQQLSERDDIIKQLQLQLERSQSNTDRTEQEQTSLPDQDITNSDTADNESDQDNNSTLEHIPYVCTSSHGKGKGCLMLFQVGSAFLPVQDNDTTSRHSYLFSYSIQACNTRPMLYQTPTLSSSQHIFLVEHHSPNQNIPNNDDHCESTNIMCMDSDNTHERPPNNDNQIAPEHKQEDYDQIG